MTLCRFIAPKWLQEKTLPRAIEGEYSDENIQTLNESGYNVYVFPNYPSDYTTGTTVDGTKIDTFEYVFVDCDLKDGVYKSKEDFLETLGDVSGLCPPTKVVDSGNGIHAYWRVTNLDAMSYLRFQRRLMRLLKTDPAVGQLLQLMRLPNTWNTKKEGEYVKCVQLYSSDVQYTAEQLDSALPPITLEDEEYCKTHYDRTFGFNQEDLSITGELPAKFGALIKNNKEAKELFAGNSDDRSKDDFRLGHLMFANDFTKEEAANVLVNTAKASQRAPIHRSNYAKNIVDKIWTFEIGTDEDKEKLDLSRSVKEILQRTNGELKGQRFQCHPRIDNTEHGFRLGQVIGLVAGSGVGKTAFALNMFKWFAQNNPDYHHFFIPLEQPANEIADRWKTMCQEDTSLHEKVHIMSNYDDNGNFRHLSFEEIREYIERFKRVAKVEVGCVVIDHIGALKKKGKDGENQDLMDICHSMKAFSIQTNTLLVMQSQTSREKAGIGDLDLDKDAAYGTVYFESYCDYLLTLHQPLKRCHSDPACPTVTAFKFCKIRHKKAKLDVIKEDTLYYLAFDPDTERMEDMTQDQKTSFDYFYKQSVNKRKADRKTELVPYQSVPYKDKSEQTVQTTRE